MRFMNFGPRADRGSSLRIVNSRIVTILRRTWQWLTLVRADDPVRAVLNRGFAYVITALTLILILLNLTTLLSNAPTITKIVLWSVVLVVEDEPGVRALVARVLGNLGYTVLEAGEGDEALRLINAYTGPGIDLLLTDVIMPRLGGRSLAAYMAAGFPDIKILFTSGYAEHGMVHQGELDPSVAFLAKPFSAAVLAHKVRAVLDS